ncbi:MAG: hypothetical protein LBF93_10935, partial [Zoogloeaceae bacterium]|nr:hypothetical protein [Zoogloeaceae bacterium]
KTAGASATHRERRRNEPARARRRVSPARRDERGHWIFVASRPGIGGQTIRRERRQTAGRPGQNGTALGINRHSPPAIAGGAIRGASALPAPRRRILVFTRRERAKIRQSRLSSG